MSLYLSHIAALSLNLAETVQPRLAGFFEASPEIFQPPVEPLENFGLEHEVPIQEHSSRSSIQDKQSESSPAYANQFATSHAQSQVQSGHLGSVQAAPMPDSQPPFPRFANAEQAAELSPKFTSTQQQSHLPYVEPSPARNAEQSKLAVDDIYTVTPKQQNHPDWLQPLAGSKTPEMQPVPQTVEHYKPAVERIVEHTVERIVVERSVEIDPLQSQQTAFFQESVEQPKQQSSGSNSSNLTADAVAAQKNSSQPAVAELKPAKLELAPAKQVFEPHVQVHTPSKEAPQSQETGNAHPQPTIQVTIGHIEIRATQPAAHSQQSKPRTASTTLSLDDYLKQRTGGRS